MQYLLANGKSMRIREAVPDDACMLLEMFKKATKETGFLMTTPEEADHISEMQERNFISRYQNDENSLFLIALTDGKIVGSLSLTQSSWQKQRHVGTFGVVVLEAYWNMGIARRLFNHLIKWVKNHQTIRYIQLCVMANNEKAIRLYQNFGFREEGRRPRAVYLHRQLYTDVILMGLWMEEHPASSL